MHDFHWRPGIGDPSFVGWFTVVAYFGAAYLCLRAFMAEKSGPVRPYGVSVLALIRVMRRHWPQVPAPARRACIWLCLAGLMTLLGINKQLDLQSLLTEIGRQLAYLTGWYEHRRVVQALFILLVLITGAWGALLFWRLARGHLSSFRLTFLGLVLLISFVVIRAASFHTIDILIGVRFVGMKLNWILELSGIGMIALGAFSKIRATRSH